MDAYATPIALGIGMFGAVVGRAVGAIDGVSDPVPQYVTQLGVTGVCIVVAWWMLRRSDARDQTARLAEEKANERAQVELRAHLEAEGRRADEAEARANHLQQQLIDLIKDGKD